MPRTPAKHASPIPATTSTTCRARGDARRPAAAEAPASSTNQVADPVATPTSSGIDARPATDAAEKIAAQDAIVSGFDAVATNAVAYARPGVATSSTASPPSRTRKALQSVRAAIRPSTIAPSRPSPIRSASI